MQENIDLQSTILSRFDLIFIVKDERSVERDMMVRPLACAPPVCCEWACEQGQGTAWSET